MCRTYDASHSLGIACGAKNRQRVRGTLSNLTSYVMLVWSWATPIPFHKYSLRVDKSVILHPDTPT